MIYEPIEAAQKQRVVARCAMAYPHVQFVCTNDGNETFRTNGTGKLQETILSIMGHDVASKMLPVLLDAGDDNYVGAMIDAVGDARRYLVVATAAESLARLYAGDVDLSTLLLEASANGWYTALVDDDFQR